MKELLKIQIKLLQEELVQQQNLYIQQLNRLKSQHKDSPLTDIEKQHQLQLFNTNYENIIEKLTDDINNLKISLDNLDK